MTPVQSLDLRVVPYRWSFAIERQDEIEAHFAIRQRERPAIWNGRVLLMNEYAIDGATLRGSFFEIDYASFMTWRDWDDASAGVLDCFASAALQTRDGAFLLGEMGQHTANAGHIYFPCGTPDLDDVVGGRVDFEGSVRRELGEETGLDLGELDVEAGWWAVRDRQKLMLAKRLRSAQDAASLRARILGNLARQPLPEFADIRIARSVADFDAMMPGCVRAYLAHAWTTPADR